MGFITASKAYTPYAAATLEHGINMHSEAETHSAEALQKYKDCGWETLSDSREDMATLRNKKAHFHIGVIRYVGDTHTWTTNVMPTLDFGSRYTHEEIVFEWQSWVLRLGVKEPYKFRAKFTWIPRYNWHLVGHQYVLTPEVYKMFCIRLRVIDKAEKAGRVIGAASQGKRITIVHNLRD